MIFLTHLPDFVAIIFRGLPGVWKNRHRLIFCWFVYSQALTPNKKTVTELSKWSPANITEWRLRRFLDATYININLLLSWFAEEAIKGFPAPSDGVIYAVGDGSHKEKRSKKNPTVQKGKKSKDKPFFWGIKFVLIALCWDVYRIPVGFRIILPKTHPDYKKENVLFREMLSELPLPSWAETVIVTGDSGYGAKENMKLVQKMDKEHSKNRRWFFVFSIARTWKQENGESIKDFVKNLAYSFYKRTWIKHLTDKNRRKTFWIYGKTINLNHIGEVTVVLSKRWRNAGPDKTKIIVTNLPDVTAREVISIYQRRWSVEVIFKELKSGSGLGEHQVTKKEHRIKNSIGISIISYLFLLIACKDEINEGCSWGIFQLQDKFRIKVIKHQLTHSMNLQIKKLQKAA